MADVENLQPRIGARVRARGRTWVVTDVDLFPACRVVTLAPTASTSTADTRRLVVPFDDVVVDDATSSTRRVGARAWRRAWLHLVSTDGDATALRSAPSARIDLLSYQLEPALALLRGAGSRLLIADEVGLGKTIQAMLATAELRARGLASRVLVICPAGLRDQWVDEWQARFDLPFTAMDHLTQRRVSSTLPYGMNPWRAEPLVVASIDYVKRADVLPSVLSAGWDVVIVDEAHGACGLSERQQAVSQLCRRSPWVLLLSATPHNGDDAAFGALCGFGRHEAAHAEPPLVVFRRSRVEAGRDAGRRVHTLRVTCTDAERRMHAALAALTQAVRRESAEMDPHAWLVLSLLHKRALSSAHALATSVERRLQVLGLPADTRAQQLAFPWDDESGDLDGADAAPIWSMPVLHDSRHERRLLERVLDTAREAAGREAKLHRLHRLLRALREPVIVFTEYRDTLLHLRAQVAPDAAVVHGGLTRAQRREALDRFASGRVLLATDAAGEGLNLQARCRTVINLELPWNPMRLEQRIGRVDRIGQRARVHVVHLVAGATAEVSLLDRLCTRVSRAHARVGAPDPLSGRPAWNEEASARLVILDADTPAIAVTPEVPRPIVPLTRLAREGLDESTRLAAIRRWTAPDPRDPVHGADTAAGVGRASTLVTSTRRTRARLALGGAPLACFRTTVTNEAGQVVASRLTGLRDTRDAAGGTPRAHVGQLRLLEPAMLQHHATWITESVGAHTRVVTLYARRLAGVQACLPSQRGEQQPGLFDRRADAFAERFEDEHRAVRADILERLARCDAMLRPGRSASELVLVIEPRGWSP